MRRLHTSRRGKTLVLFALLLPVLAGMVGLVIDTGLLLAAHRQLQNAADAAAMSTAMDQLRGLSFASASSSASTLLQTQYGLPASGIDIHSPPTRGPYAGNTNYVEAVLTQTMPTYFISIVGSSSVVSTTARAVAGVENRTPPWTAMTLDPNATPGLSIAGTVQINGTVMVCSLGAGSDQNGGAIDLGVPPCAVATGSAGGLQTLGLQSAGGVDDPTHFGLLFGGSGSALKVTQRIASDPLLYLQTPTTGAGVQMRYPDAQGNLQAAPQKAVVTVNDASSSTLLPGVYSSITITGGGTGTVTFQPGVYVLLGGQDPALKIATTATVQGAGVLFYNTGSDFLAGSGLPDGGDGNSRPGAPSSGASFGGIQIQAGALRLSGLNDSSSPFAGLVIYQRRANTSAIAIQGATATDSVQGTIYARWANLNLSGPGNYQAQFITGSLAVTAPATAGNLTISQGSILGKAPQVYLVE